MDSIVHIGDCRDVLAGMPDASVDAVVTDPPYELGFMGKGWDAAGIAYDTAMWAEVLRVLKPGGHLLAFGGTRTYHRMACAIEDAGFEIRDSINWLYGCLTDDVEVLTEHGWVPGTDVTVGDRVAQWEPVTGVVSLASVEDTFRAPWDGPLVALCNSDTDQLLTPNHRVYWQRNAHRSANNVEFREWVTECSKAADVPRRSQIRLPLAGVHDGPGIGGTDYAALLGWVWTEGHFDAIGTGVRIYQSSVNQTDCDTIAGLMDRMGAHKRYDRDRVYRGRTYTESTWFFTGDLAQRVRADLPSKHPTYELLWRMSAAEIEAFYAAAIAGDGHVTKSGSATFEQKDPLDREWFVTLLALSNRRGHDYARPRGGGSVSVTRSPWTNLSPKRMAQTEQVFYTGDVWCVKVPSGAFVARRNGKVFITGNSGFPKSHNLKGDREGWGTALKPAHEPIVVARKPLIGTVAANVLEYGTGALNIDGCRVGHVTVAEGNLALNPHLRQTIRGGNGGHVIAHETEVREGSAAPEGRWPANLVLTHHPDCQPAGTTSEPVGGGAQATSGFATGYEHGDGWTGRTVDATTWDCHPDCPAAIMDGQSGYLHGSGNKRDTDTGTHSDYSASGYMVSYKGRANRDCGDAGGGASRFFTQTTWDCHPDCPAAIMDGQSGITKDGVAVQRNGRTEGSNGYNGGWGRGPRPDQGYGTSGGASRFFTQTTPDLDGPSFLYQAKANKRERNAGLDDRNPHPTVKPVAVMEWLVRLVTPPGGVVLDPFTGSGTTGIAATRQGFQFIGIEQDADYAAIAEARIHHHNNQPATTRPPQPATPDEPDDPQPEPPDDQPTLF